MKFKNSLSVPIICILILVGCGTLYVGYYINIHTLQETLEAREADKARATYFFINSEIEDEVKEISALAKLLKENPALVAALAHYYRSQGDFRPLQQVMDRLYANFRNLGPDIFLVTDGQGKIVYQVNSHVDPGDAHLVWGMDEALAGQDIITTSQCQHGWEINAMVPLYAADKLSGVLVVGTRLTDNFAQKIATATNTNISLGTIKYVWASSWPPAQRNLVDLDIIYRSIYEKRPFFHNDYPLNQSFLYVPLRVADETFCLIINSDTSAISEMLKQKRTQLITSFIIMFLMVTALGSGLTFSIIRPLRKLQSRAQGVIKEFAGEDVPLRARGNEIQTLSRAFDLMLTSINQYISGLNQAEEALRDREEKYRLLVNQAPAIVFKGYGDWSVDFFDSKIEALTGYAKEDFDSRRVKWCDLIPPEDFDYVQRTFIEALKTNKSYVREHRLRKKNGEIIWVQCRGLIFCDAQGKVDHISGVTFDVTERRRAEEALGEGERFLASILDSIQDGISILDTEFNVLRVNPTLERWFAHALPLVGKKCYEAYRGREEPCEVCSARQTLETGEAAFDVVPKMGGGGETVGWLEVYTFPLVDLATGKTKGAIQYMRDVTERKLAEEALRQSEEQLRQAQKMEAVGRLAGGVAHDFNNMLTAITGYAELLLMSLNEQDLVRQDVGEIKKAADRAASLTGQLLAFSRKQVLQPRELDFNAVVANVDKMLRRIIGEDIELVTVLSAGLGLVKADPGQLDQVIMNLAVNARDAMPQGGKLTIEAANVDLDEHYARHHAEVQPGPYVLLAMSDTGCGMDAEARSRIFEPFFTTKGHDGGTGLGLSTVYGIIKQSGGHIWVYSEPGQGTTFKIYLPRLQDAVAVVTLEPVPAPSLKGTETILLVEDEEVVRQVTLRMLQRNGYRVLAARHGPEALDIGAHHLEPIQLLLTDVVMPEMSGRELAEHLTAIHPETKVIYMSGYTENAIVHHGSLDQGLAFIQKPFKHDLLASKIREVLEAPDS